ncbi:MAG TPA: aminotransferase class V-fold PLP-dependent enzyme, partial [Thermoanaerobaculia bacterium]|nr:aminotransferase class V-fold PLP-dependent enzyme [Thermoanaerobaculia bacterium]
CQWLQRHGGLAAIGARNEQKASLLYDALDGSGGFYRPTAEPGSRSRMNVTFRLADEAQEERFAKEATAASLVGLKGHRAVGGLRASIYNAMPVAGVEALVGFMREFQQRG